MVGHFENSFKRNQEIRQKIVGSQRKRKRLWFKVQTSNPKTLLINVKSNQLKNILRYVRRTIVKLSIYHLGETFQKESGIVKK